MIEENGNGVSNFPTGKEVPLHVAREQLGKALEEARGMQHQLKEVIGQARQKEGLKGDARVAPLLVLQSAISRAVTEAQNILVSERTGSQEPSARVLVAARVAINQALSSAGVALKSVDLPDIELRISGAIPKHE